MTVVEIVILAIAVFGLAMGLGLGVLRLVAAARLFRRLR